MNKNQKQRRYKSTEFFIGAAGTIGIISCLILVFTGYPWIGVVTLGATSLPAVIFVSVSLVVLGASAPYRPLVSRESLLWSWLNFLGRGSAGVLLLVSGSLVGGLLGILIADPDGDLSILVFFGAAVVWVWLTVIVLMWTVRAAIDVARLGDQRELVIEKWLAARGTPNAVRKAERYASGSDLTFVWAAGGVMLVLLTAALFGIGELGGL